MSAKPKVLVVEDIPAEGALLRDALAAAGYSVVRARGMESGLLQARHEQPALVLLDVHLPGQDGWEAVRRLKADPLTARIPAVVLTDVHPARRVVHDSACDAWHGKPVAEAELLVTVAELLGRRKS